MPVDRRLQERVAEFHLEPHAFCTSVFIALNSIDINCSKAGFRFNSYVDNVSTTRLTWHIDSGDDTLVHSAGVALVAFT